MMELYFIRGHVSVHDPADMQAGERDSEKPSPSGTDLAYELSGEMPCATCGYNLAGLSVLERCPECGTQIRDTLLMLVDPFAQDVPKVRHPRLIAVAVLGWSGSALLACTLLIGFRVSSILCESRGVLCGSTDMDSLGLAMIFCAAAFAIGTLHPLRSTRMRQVCCTIAGIVTLILAAITVLYTLRFQDPYRESPYIVLSDVDTRRTLERMTTHTLLLLSTLFFRPNARAISSTSWRFRGNHENKQRLVTVAASLAAIIVGDTIRLSAVWLPAGSGDVVAVSGAFLIFGGTGIFLFAVLGVCIDSARIAQTLWRVPMAFRDVVRRSLS